MVFSALAQWFEVKLGLRYTRAGKASRRNGFISFISMISMLGIALGVAALIIVLSVVNGFQKEVRDKMLSAIAHVEVFAPGMQALDNVALTLEEVKKHPDVLGAAPFVASEALLVSGDVMKGAQVRGIDAQLEPTVTDLAKKLGTAKLAEMQPGSFKVLIGLHLADSLGVREGDSITLMAPSGQVTPAGTIPRFKELKIAGVFESGHYEYDATLLLMGIADAQTLFRFEGPSGVRLRLKDQHDSPRVANELAGMLSGDLLVRDWTMQNRTWFEAVKIEKRMLGIILFLIVLVSAFNLITSLVMTVTDKRADIAILRTLGASPKSIMGIFMVQGSVIGVVGTLTGLAVGLLVAFNVSSIVAALEVLLQTSFLPQSIYLINRMPSDPQAGDIVPVVVVSLVLSFAATIYPSWRASRVNPAEALRYE